MLTSEEISDYRQENELCEIWPHLPEEERRKLGANRHPNGSDIHHIALGPNKRIDELTNLIHLSRNVHSHWCHKYPADQLVLCLWVKQGKGELDWGVMDRIMGKRMPGFLDTESFANRIHFDWIQPKREELLNGVV